MEFFGRELVSRQTQMIQHDQFKSKNCFMKLARGVPVDAEGFPIFKTVSQGRALLPGNSFRNHFTQNRLMYQLFSNADRSYERNYANSWRNDQLEAAVVVLMKQMINRSAKSNMSIVEDVRDQDANPFGNRTSNKRKVKFFTLNHFQSLSKEDHLRFKAATIIFASTKTTYFQFLR